MRLRTWENDLLWVAMERDGVFFFSCRAPAESKQWSDQVALQLKFRRGDTGEIEKKLEAARMRMEKGKAAEGQVRDVKLVPWMRTG